MAYKQTESPKRAGAAAVEFSLIIPILLLLTFGTLEACSALFLKEKVTIAAHEGARVAIKKMASAQNARDVMLDYLASRDVNTAALNENSITISPDPQRVETLNPLTVTVTVPMAGNGILPNAFYTWFGDKSVQAQVVMYKEFTHPTYEAELAAAAAGP